MKTVADFKRAMLPGTTWQATHMYNDKGVVTDLGERVCGLNNTVNFGFIIPEKENRISHCDWPKASECTFDGDKVTINKGWVTLTYEKID